MYRPDNCDGTYESFCDRQRSYRNITQILEAGDVGGNTLSFMDTYWKDLRGHDEYLYEHEWSKHGTCISTLQPECYSDYNPQEEVVVYFRKTVELFKTLPSYKVSLPKPKTFLCGSMLKRLLITLHIVVVRRWHHTISQQSL